MIFFTGDHHFFHRNIIEYCNRPFQYLNEMDGTMIVNWNKIIKHNDNVYHLGDFTLAGEEKAKEFFSGLNGHIRILSNPWHHDRRWLKDRVNCMLDWTSASGHQIQILPPMFVLTMPKLGDGKHPKAIVLCHYPLAKWDRKHYGSWHLYGHSHGQFDNGGLSMDVGVDANNFYPVSLEEVTAIMRKRADGGKYENLHTL